MHKQICWVKIPGMFPITASEGLQGGNRDECLCFLVLTDTKNKLNIFQIICDTIQWTYKTNPKKFCKTGSSKGGIWYGDLGSE
jgi:hypothetical protein